MKVVVSGTSQCGFSLVELLVVMAIVSVLAALLFPAFAKARGAANQVAALSNLKQVGIGFNLYSEDYEEFYPMADYGGNGSAHIENWGEWTDALHPYVESGHQQVITRKGDQNFAHYGGEGIYIDPDFPSPGQLNQFGVNQAVCPDNQFSSGLDGVPNGDWFGTSWNLSHTAPGPVVSDSNIDDPTRRILLVLKGANASNPSARPLILGDEVDWVAGNPGDYNPSTGATNDFGPGWYGSQDCDSTSSDAGQWHGCDQYPRYLHNGNTLVVFPDSHAKAMHKGTINYGQNVYIQGFSNRGEPIQ